MAKQNRAGICLRPRSSSCQPALISQPAALQSLLGALGRVREDLPVAIWEIKNVHANEDHRAAGKNLDRLVSTQTSAKHELQQRLLGELVEFPGALGQDLGGICHRERAYPAGVRRGRASMGTKARRGYYGLGPLDWYQAIRHRSACTKPWWNAKRPSRAACRRQARRQWNKLRRVLSEGREREWSPRRRQTELCGDNAETKQEAKAEPTQAPAGPPKPVFG